MKKLSLSLAAVCAALAAPAFAQEAAEGPWLVRVRAVHLDSRDGDSTGLRLNINDRWIPEVDISYFLTPNIAAELVLTVPQKHKVRAGATQIGTLKHLPPTLSVQYHFAPGAAVRPYLGAGLNYTRFSGVNLPAGVSIERHSVGASFQAGVDIPVARNLVLNLDVKKLRLRTDVSAAGTTIGTFAVDPVLVGVGLGWRF